MLGSIRVSSMLAALFVITLIPLLIVLHVKERKLAAAGMIAPDTLPSIKFLLTAKPTPVSASPSEQTETNTENQPHTMEENHNG